MTQIFGCHNVRHLGPHPVRFHRPWIFFVRVSAPTPGDRLGRNLSKIFMPGDNMPGDRLGFVLYFWIKKGNPYHRGPLGRRQNGALREKLCASPTRTQFFPKGPILPPYTWQPGSEAFQKLNRESRFHAIAPGLQWSDVP